MYDRSRECVSPSPSGRYPPETDAQESPVTSPERPRPPLSLAVVGSSVDSPYVGPSSVPGSPSFESSITAPSIVPPIPPSPKLSNKNVSNNSYILRQGDNQVKKEYDDLGHSSERLEDLEVEVEQTHLKLKSMGLTTTDLSYSI